MSLSQGEEEVQEAVCRLVEKIVETCGDVWRQCHSAEEVERMKELHVESLVRNNRGTNVDLEKCGTVVQFRSQYADYLEEDDYFEDVDKCTEEEIIKSQANFQTCTHYITTSVNDDMKNLNSLKNITDCLCKALSDIANDCVEHLEECLDPEDVNIISEIHIEQLKVYFIKLAGNKVNEDFTLDNCQEEHKEVSANKKDIRNTQEQDSIDKMDIIEELNEARNLNKDLEGHSSDKLDKTGDMKAGYLDSDTAKDKHDSEDAVEEEAVKYVDVKTSSVGCTFTVSFTIIVFIFSLYFQYYQ